MNNDMAQQMQKLYERKAKDVESKLPWYKNPLKDYDVAPAVVLDKPFDAPSADFLKLPKATRHTTTHAMFPEHDEPRLQAKLKPTATFPSSLSHRNSPVLTDESKGTSPKPTIDTKLRYRGRVSWEANLLDSKSEASRMQGTSPLHSPKKATTQLSPLKSVLQHSVGKPVPVESAERDQLLQHMLHHDDEIDTLLSKFAVAQATKVGARDMAVAAYAARPHVYTFWDPPPAVNTELDPSAPSTPVVARRRFALQVDNSVSDDEDDDKDEEEADDDEEAAVQDQLKAAYFGYTKMHHKTQCFSAVATKAIAPETLVSEYSFKPVVHARRASRVATENEIKMSPRTLFLSDCLASTDLPLALPLLIRKHHTTSFDFSYQSLGDKFIVQFATALRDVPFVEEINVCDNRLSDRALNKLLRALEAKPNLIKLNISQNEIGVASASTLKHYIGSSLCTVTHLSICNADIDDHECAAFMSAFESNKSVVDLRLSRNRIGEAENLNVVQPNLVTGGEAIGNMLNVNLTLTHLDLAWNLLRLASGVTLANALRLNYNLYEINVAYNALGDAGAMAFGQSLEVNKSLRVLNLSYNNIRCKGASVIASTLSRTNATLHKLILDGNNIGKEGGRILMYAMVHNGTPSGCSISMKACSLNDRSNQTTFDPMEPGGVYCLNCADPYESMIAHELLRLAATKRGCIFTQLLHRPTKETPLKQAHPIKLVPPPQTPKSALDITFTGIDTDKSGTVDVGELQTVLRELGFHPTPAQAQTLFEQMDADRSGAIEPCELTGDLFRAVYRVIDANQSGTIDMHELRAAFHLLGAAPTERDVQNAMKIYDVDGSGTIEEDEFVELLKNQVIQRVQMNAQDRVVASMALREEGSGVVWKVPASGILDITFAYERELMSERETIASYGLSERGLQQLVKTVEAGKAEQQHQELLGTAVDNTEIRMSAEQAMVLMETCGELQETRRIGSVAKMLPQLVSSKEAHLLVKHVLNVRERYHLRSRMGSSYFPIMGLPTAKYELDLSCPQDRQAVLKLAEIAQAEKQFSKTRSCRGDTSQHGNWENFRNELLDGKPVVLTSAFFQNLPAKGKLEFDYISTSRPKRGTKPMSTRRFQQLVLQIGRESSIELQRPKVPLLTARQRWGLVRNAVRHRKMKAWLHRVTEVFHIRHVTVESVRDKLFQIETAVGDRWLSVNQAHEIIDCMPTLHHGKTEAIRVLFARIIDLENFATILDALSLPEQKEVARSLGWLNIMNPKFPDRYYELDLAVRDERELAKIYVALAVTEPGENWVNETFAWQRGEPPIPGWQLPISWTKDDGGPEDGPRRAGWLTLEYTSAPENGCSPVWAIRQELQTRVLCGTRLYL
ncbi:hypothetical protein SPRG_02654 [Saprolegnia parasitica CBS 223.65]|uniref:EF-hand domain-containing protein n=1 Tax=Saprolegnia parasitica (strain CBS 223.65) TaxID=695850 RepID=A0A067D1P7_SAPPC|nr:hypothetical protein SPRG_02654 [Saprolegnia parasitica CBS 223.65]KDO32962.1 hypothetical protein SPRG_02654 [Saprolegnia parasitica CBS 223.65]|eukprot:XP_012196608.1 hypothetical protein SPRG_02654 [Saprolegnia parasitica CBS 223.65]